MRIHHFRWGVLCCWWLFLAEITVFQFFEHIPRLIGLEHFGVTGCASFCPENEERVLGEMGFCDLLKVSRNFLIPHPLL